MLILTLKKLDDGGFTEHGGDGTSRNTYRLTAQGQSLLEHVGDLFHWMNANAPAILQSYRGHRPGRVPPIKRILGSR